MRPRLASQVVITLPRFRSSLSVLRFCGGSGGGTTSGSRELRCIPQSGSSS